MSRTRYTMAFDAHNMVPGPAASATVRVLWRTEDGVTDCYGTGAAPTTANTYAEGCIYRKFVAAGVSIIYYNYGTYASPDFEALLDVNNVVDQIEAEYLATAADDGGPSPLLWDDAPVLETILNPGKGFHIFEDFLKMKTEAEVAGTITQNTGSGSLANQPTLAAGIAKLTNGAATNDHSTNLAFLGMQCKPGVGTHIYFEARVKVVDDAGGVFIGLADDSSTDIGGSGTIAVTTDHAGFFRDNGTTAADMGTQACDGTDVTSADDECTDVDKSAYETFGIHIFGDGDTAGDYVKFYHKGVLVTTVTDADGGGDDGVPDAVICPTFNIDNLSDSAEQGLLIDWMKLLVYNATSETVREA